MPAVLIEPAYAGPVSYFRSLARADAIVFDVHAHYEKRSFRNRCEILGANGKLSLSIPLLHGKGQKQPLRDVRISYSENWRKDHWISLVSAYRRSPYFEFYEDTFRTIYSGRPDYLVEFNLSVWEAVMRSLKLQLPYRLSTEYVVPGAFTGEDLRDRFRPAAPGPVRSYLQVFSDRNGFVPDLSILDMLFNLGPESQTRLFE